MNSMGRESFVSRWKKYFNSSELPLTFYYTDKEGPGLVTPGSVNRCIIAALLKARKGEPMRFNAESIGCFGGRRYAGFATEIMPDFEYFLSCGIPGKLEGERYKKSPEIVKESVEHQAPFVAPGKYIVFKRWDLLEEADDPEVVIFFVKPDVLAGLFTLANYDQTDPNSVISPFGSGCSSIIYHPYFQSKASQPKPVIGMFDISARPFVDKYVVSFAVPLNRFLTMVSNMDESFLITRSWGKIHKRIADS
jgi:hypothetical protein